MDELTISTDSNPIPANHVQAAASILKKIKAIYNLADISPARSAQVDAKISSFMNNEHIDKKGWDASKCLTEKGEIPSPEISAKLTAICNEFIKRVIESEDITDQVNSLYSVKHKATKNCRVRTYVNTVAAGKSINERLIFTRSNNANRLLDTYTTHLLLGTVEKIEQLGYSSEQSYQICGKIIGTGVKIYKGDNKEKICTFEPQYDPSMTPSENLQYAKDFWVDKVRRMERSARAICN